MSENEATSDQDDVSFIRTDDMVCLQCSETGERVCLAAEGFGNRHCFLESIANKNYPPEMPSCVFVIEQALSVRALQEMVTAESSDLKQPGSSAPRAGQDSGGRSDAGGATGGAGAGSGPAGAAGGGGEPGEEMAEGGPGGSAGGTDASTQLSASQLTSKGIGASGGGGDSGGVGGGNRTLLYGHAVLLRHLHSGMHLATLSICSSSDKLAFDVGLKDSREVGESCWWTVHPGSKQRSEGEKVRFGDDLILVSVATERYLHYTSTDLPLVPPMASASAAAVMTVSTVMAGKQAIVNASFHSTHWSIAPFGTGLSRMKNVGYVFGGQVLRLLHGGDECLTVSAGATGETTASSGTGGGGGNETVTNKQQQQVDVIYEGGAVMNQARSLWRLDLIRTRWSGGFVQYLNALRIRHITTGNYLGVNEQLQLCLLPKVDASVERTAFCLRLTKDDNKGSKAGDAGDDKDEEVIGMPMIKYGDSSFFIQHIESQTWLSYRSFETKKRGIGRVEEKQAILSAEGKMDDCLEFSRSQEEEAKTARVIRKCDALFSKFIKILDHVQQVALMERAGGGGGGQDGSLMNGVGGGGGARDSIDLDAAAAMAHRNKRRPSVAAAAMSSLAPLFGGLQAAGSSSSTEQELQRAGLQHKEQAAGGQQSSTSGQQRVAFQSTPATPPPPPVQQQFSSDGSLFCYTSQVEMSKCLEDLIDYFAPPEEGCDHEQEQNRLRALRNRQDLFQEEGILNLILDAIDKINLISGQGLLVLLLGEESSATWEAITGYFYQLLAAIIKDNHTNCAQFAQAHRLNWLFSRLSSQQASEGTGMLDVLHYVLVDSPEALNMLKESHIKVLISLLEKHGRDPKVLNVLCSLCVSNGVAIRSSQNTITNHLLPGRNLLLQTRLVDHVASMKPNIYVARVDGSAMYHRWYYEVIVDHIEMINNLSPHLRVGWANTKGYLPYPGGGSYWGTNGVGDDFYSYGFDGQYLWSAGRPTLVRLPPSSTMTRQEQQQAAASMHPNQQQQPMDYQNQQQALLESYASQQTEFVANQNSSMFGADQQAGWQSHQAAPWLSQHGQQQGLAQQQQGRTGQSGGGGGGATDGLTSMSNLDNFAHSPYLRLQKNDVIGCLIDLSVPAIQFTINGKQIFGFFKNFNVTNGGFFHPVVSFSAKVSCRFLFGSNQGELRYRPPAGFSPLVEVLLPNQEVSVESCFTFGDLAKQTVSGPQITPDSLPQTVMDLIFIPRVIDTRSIELGGGGAGAGSQLESLRDCLAENMHELWSMSRIEDGWIYGDEHDDQNRTHPYLVPFSMLPALGKKYKLDLASQTIKIILGLGYKITPPATQGPDGSSGHRGQSQPGKNLAVPSASSATGQRMKIYRLPNMPYLQSNGYKPAPLDLSSSELTPKVNHLVELLAENIHNIWAAEKISLKWTYRRRDPLNELADDYIQDGRTCHLLPYKYVDDEIKLKNRQSALETVFTISAYGYHIEPSAATTLVAGAGGGSSAPIGAGGSGGGAGGDPMTPMIQEVADQSVGGSAGGLLSPSPSGAAGSHSPLSRGGGSGAGPTSRPTSAAGGQPTAGGHQAGGADTGASGHEVILNNAPEVGLRHYRAERTYAVHSGRWYYEVEVHTIGHIQIGWANLNFRSSSPALGSDENSWAFDCHTGRKVHGSNYESFGQVASVGDVIGCMLDLNDRTVSYSLNGKLMLDYLGNEMAFIGMELPNDPTAGGYVPAVSLGVNQRVRLSFGQDVEQLRFFTDYGLQEGYHPFCVNMHKPITLWFNKREPNFVNCDDLDPSQCNIEVTRIPPGSDSPPALKIAYKQFESQERANWEYLRLSLPVTIQSELIDETDKIAKMQEIQAQQLRLAYSQAREFGGRGFARGGGFRAGGLHGDDPNAAVRHPARLEQHMLQSGFSMADVKDLQRSYETGHAETLTSGYLSGLRQNIQQNQQQQQQRRQQQLVKTRSVDEQGKQLQQQQQLAGGPSLAVPTFTEAQRMMAERAASQRAALKGRTHAGGGGFGLTRAGGGSSTSLENLAQQQATTGDASGQAPHPLKATAGRSRSTFKAIFGSMKGSSKADRQTGSQSDQQQQVRSHSLSRHHSTRLNVPKISIQNDGLGGGPAGGGRSRSMSRSESYSSLLGGILGGGGGGDGQAAGASGLAASAAGGGGGAGRGLVRRLSRVGLGGATTTGGSGGGGGTLKGQQQQLLGAGGLPASHSSGGVGHEQTQYDSSLPTAVPFDLQQLDPATLELIDEYYYGVRIFPGQEPSHVMCGWVTSHFKHESLASLQDVQHTQIIQTTSLLTGQAEVCERRECYLLNAGQLYKEMHPAASSAASGTGGAGGDNLGASAASSSSAGGGGGSSGGTGATETGSPRSNRGMLIGCHVDSSTGVLTFTVDGKMTKYRFNLEPQTKLYPGIFFQATTGDCLQFELSRTPLTLPLSAAILSLTPKHVNPQCPPRLKVQTLQSCSWSRVPNVSLRPNSLKLSDCRGWSMLADDPLAMLVVHIPEENRCLDVLELIEQEKLLKFHSNTLILYGALCAQGNHKVAHIICSHVDQRQLLYAINSDYLSGDLRRGFADLLIALHLEFHAYGRHLTQNEFIVPISKDLGQLYGNGTGGGSGSETDMSSSSLIHSFSRIECVSIRTEMNMSPVGFDLSSMEGVTGGGQTAGATTNLVKILSTPYFPIRILKKLVFQALNEAVFKGNLPIRDLPGGSNENLFVPLLKLADKLLLIGCVTNQELGWLLSLIDPETFERPAVDHSVDTTAPATSGAIGGPASDHSHGQADLSFLALGANSPSSTWKPTILEQPMLQGNVRQTIGSKGLLQMRKLDEHVKLIICHILHHLLDIQLRHRIESIMAFSVNFVGQLQTDQRRRYNEIKSSNLPSHLTARKTREFRCSPREQMRYILNFKNNSDPDDLNASPSSESLRATLKHLHLSMMKQIQVIIESGAGGGDGQQHNGGGDDHYARQRIMSSLGDGHAGYGYVGSSSSSGSSSIFSSFKRLLRVLKLVKATLASGDSKIESHLRQQNGHFASLLGHSGQTELKFIKEIVKTVVKWAEESAIENKQLVRQMFHLLLRCYNGVGELIEALNNSYVIGEKSKQDVIDLLQVLSKVRALLAVQMGPAEEEVMRDCLWTLVNNVVFFQHPDLIRILRVHENVMHVMMNTLSKRSRAASAASSGQQQQQAAAQLQQAGSGGSPPEAAGSAASSAQAAGLQQQGRQRTLSIPGPGGQPTSGAAAAAAAAGQGQQPGGSTPEANSDQEDDISKMVVSCCRFLCFFCRSSAKNQKAMFEHLGFLLENSNILLSRPSLRGSTPLDVAYSSLMENHELVLALRESYLEKIAIYLSRCGLQSNQELIDKGYPDVGWDPVEGERYLDFLRFCVWVNGESVEENSNLVIRLLIRRPECLGPALRGEGPGLFAAIKDAIGMADSIHADQQAEKRRLQLEAGGQQQLEAAESQQQQQQQMIDGLMQGGAAGGGAADQQAGDAEEEDEDQINMGSAILNFYCALVDLLGRCAPDLQTIGQGKHESIRARSILKSLVPLQDLKSAISMRFSLVNPQCAVLADGDLPFASTVSSFMPNHKQSLVLFLERVYGIEDQETFFSLLEEAFLPDMRAATMLEKCTAPPAASQPAGDSSYAAASQFSGSGATTGAGGQLAEQGDDSDNGESPENEMTLALNRYLGNSAIPLLIREAHYFKNAENYANLLEPTLHTVYRLSKVKILTKGQRESVSDFLIALTREMQPHQLLKLLRKLTVDVAVLNESTTVALRLLTLHYERCSKYYGYTGSAQTSASGVFGTATEEERRLTMVLFTNIFDSLSLMDYDPELFENALPCLNALACALPPDYSLTESRDFSHKSAAGASKGGRLGGGQGAQSASQMAATAAAAAAAAAVASSQTVGPYIPQPVETRNVELTGELKQMAQRFSEHYHDAWASRKLDRDWTYGEQYNFKQKTHPRLKPYALLSQHERDRYIEPIEEAMRGIIAMGWTIDRLEQDPAHRSQQAAAGSSSSRAASRADIYNQATLAGAILDPAQRRDMIQNYNPQPADTSNLSLSRELQNLAERSAENAHDLWAKKTMEDWEMKLRSTVGDVLRTPIMLHPLMVPYDLLTDKEKRKNRDRSQELLKYMLFEGYKVFRVDELAAQQQQQQQQQMQFQRGRISSRAGVGDSSSSGGGGNTAAGQMSVSSKRRFAYSILDKLLSYTDTVMVKLELLKPSSNFSRRSSFKQSDRDVKFFSKVVLPLIERYFTAHREFFLTYYGLQQSGSSGASGAPGGGGATSAAASGGTAAGAGGGAGGGGGPSSGVSPSGSSQLSAAAGGVGTIDDGGPTTNDMEAQFGGSGASATVAAIASGMGCATVKEKEMLATLFCKLAAILRNKLSVIGPDAKIFVRCLQVLTRALDARLLSEQSPDFIKTSMLTYFNKTGQDLSQCVFNLQMKRYNAVRGTTMLTSSSLYHVHLAVLPTLTALFDHLASSESGKYLLLDEIQVACHRILQSLYLLGTRIQLAGSHVFSRKELERHRHSYGNCLAAFSAAFPIAFLEPELIRFNRFSCLHTKSSQQSSPLGAAAVATLTLAPPPSGKQHRQAAATGATSGGSQVKSTHSVELPALPSLEELMKLVNKFVQTGKATNGAGAAVGASGSGSSATGHHSAASGAGASTGGQSQASSHSVGGQQSSSGAGANQSGAGGRGSRGRHTGAGMAMIPADNDTAIIEVIVPMLCSYLPFWHSQGPEALSASARNLGAGNGSTQVSSRYLNELLKDIMNLIKRQVGLDDGLANFNWMVSIAAHASQIIIDSPETNLLGESFLPLSTKIAQRAESIYHREELMRGYLKSAATEDTTAIEEKIQEEFHTLVRDIYAFYPLLIKYVDYKKSSWLKQRGFAAQSRAQTTTATNNDGGNKLLVNGGNNQQHQSAAELQSDLYQQLEAEQNKPEQLLFQQVATVFDIWSNSQYFRREEQNFISQHEIDNMALIMQASNRPGRTFFQKSDPTQTGSSAAGKKKNKRRHGEKRDRDREVASSLLVVALKRLLPIGMNLFEGRERELVQHVKERFLKKDSPTRIEEIVRLQLTQPYQVDPSDEFCWQHFLYSRLGAQPPASPGSLASGGNNNNSNRSPLSGLAGAMSNGSSGGVDVTSIQGGKSGYYHDSGAEDSRLAQQQQHFVVDSRIVARIVDMARVFYGLHIIDHPNLQRKAGKRSCVSTQRRRVVIACFRMTSLHSLPSHRAINIFLRSYCDTWLLEENFGQEKLIEDLTQTFEQAEMKLNGDENLIPRNDPLSQLIMTLSRQATTEHGSGSTTSGAVMMAALDGADANGVDRLYLQFADIFRMSCGGDEDDDDDGENGGDDNNAGGDQNDNNNNDDEQQSAAERHRRASGGSDADDSGYGGGGDDEGSSKAAESGGASTIHEQEMEKQRLLFQQSRLSDRGVAEMILLYISAFSRYQGAGSVTSASSAGGSTGSSGAGGHNLSQHTPMILSTLKLGISILRGGNVEVQRRMLKHLKDKKDVGFFTSIQLLMNSCSVLDLDAFERNQKAEALGVRSEGPASEKNMYDAEFTCKLFRFFQLLCEGHNLEFQNYLRTQAGNTTTVNVVISTVDYLLRLQESIMDFYWHYSSKEVIDPSGTENFIKAITIAKQVFCTLTESIQGPCPQNQQALAHSRLWHAVGGFLFLFAHMQDKLSRNSSQLNLLIELLDLQKEMVIMMLSMLEGNVVNGTIGKQMVETLVESSGNVEIILKFFDMFLKLPRLTSSTNFQEYDKTGSGWISLADLRKAMEQHKIYTPEETQYLLSCCEANHDGMIDYREFIDRFHQPAKDIGFNLAVLLTNLAEHITNEPRLQRFLETASTVLNYFEPYLGRIEIMGSSKRIERVYFEIKESTLDQWAKPQIQESKRAFFYSIVTEGDGKEKLEAFVNFCEDTIFEMQHASNILGEDEEPPPTKADKYPFDAGAAGASSGQAGGGGGGGSATDTAYGLAAMGGGGGGQPQRLNHKLWLGLIYDGLVYLIGLILLLFNHLRPARMRRRLARVRHMTYGQLVWASLKLSAQLGLGSLKLGFNCVYSVLKFILRIMTDDTSLTSSSNAKLTGAQAAAGQQLGIGGIRSSALAGDSLAKPGDLAASRRRLSSLTARTELIVGPSLMTARVSDIMPPVDSARGTGPEALVVGDETVSAAAAAAAANNLPATGGGGGDSYMEMLAGSAAKTATATMMKQQAASGVFVGELGVGAAVAAGDQSYLSEIGLMDELEVIHGIGAGAQRGRKSKGIGARLAQLTCYNQRIVSFLARNFYRIKLLALVTAFVINFILLFYKVTVWSLEANGEPVVTSIAMLSAAAASKAAAAASDATPADSSLQQQQQASDSSRLDRIEGSLRKSLTNYKNHYGGQEHATDDGNNNNYNDDDDEPDDDAEGDDGNETGGDDADEDTVDTEQQDDDDDEEASRKTSGRRRGRKGRDNNKATDKHRRKKEPDDEDVDAEQNHAGIAADGRDDDDHDDDDDDHDDDDDDHDDDDDDDDDEEAESTAVAEWVVMEEKYYYLQPILTLLASVHSLFSLCMLIAYYHLKVPLVIFKREKEIARKLEFDGIYITEEPDSENWWNGHWDKLVISAQSFPVNYWDKFVKKRVREKYREQYDYESLSNLLGMDKHGSSSIQSHQGGGGRFTSWLLQSWLLAGLLGKVDWRYQLWKAGVTLTDQSFQYQLLYLCFSLAGHFNYFFFAAHLLDVAVGFKKLQTILQSVTHNGKQLVLTVMLLTIVVYIYTVIAFNFFRKFYVQGEESAGEPKCHSMMTCFVYHLYQGVRAGGGIGDVIEAPDGDDYEVYRIIFDITFFFFVIVILLAIIQGLIIDAFGELRDQLLTVAADMESNCFICGIGKDVLDKVPRGFDTHVQKEHNLANYMFFLMHLINKPDTDYTGQETYVWELYQRRCWDFFPVGECFRTQSEEEADAKPGAKD